MSESMRTCPMCAFAFEKDDTVCGHGCPLGATCRLLRCPACGYEFPENPITVSWVTRLLGRRVERACGLPDDVRPLRSLASGERARVSCVGVRGTGRSGRLAGFGLVPGAEITVVQQRPTTVVRVDETELALDGAIAEEILVTPVEPTPASAEAGSSPPPV